MYDSHTIKKAANVIRAINHELRKKLLEYISKEKEVTVTELYVAMRMEQSVASQHLAILRNAGIVKVRRDGKYIYYSVDQERLAQVVKICEDLTAKK